VSVNILSKELYMYTCPIPNGFRDKVILLYSSKIVDKKKILPAVLIPAFIVRVAKLVQFTPWHVVHKRTNSLPSVMLSLKFHRQH
jgi:hypothetical protein